MKVLAENVRVQHNNLFSFKVTHSHLTGRKTGGRQTEEVAADRQTQEVAGGRQTEQVGPAEEAVAQAGTLTKNAKIGQLAD